MTLKTQEGVHTHPHSDPPFLPRPRPRSLPLSHPAVVEGGCQAASAVERNDAGGDPQGARRLHERASQSGGQGLRGRARRPAHITARGSEGAAQWTSKLLRGSEAGSRSAEKKKVRAAAEPADRRGAARRGRAPPRRKKSGATSCRTCRSPWGSDAGSGSAKKKALRPDTTHASRCPAATSSVTCDHRRCYIIILGAVL